MNEFYRPTFEFVLRYLLESKKKKRRKNEKNKENHTYFQAELESIRSDIVLSVARRNVDCLLEQSPRRSAALRPVPPSRRYIARCDAMVCWLIQTRVARLRGNICLLYIEVNGKSGDFSPPCGNHDSDSDRIESRIAACFIHS